MKVCSQRYHYSQLAVEFVLKNSSDFLSLHDLIIDHFESMEGLLYRLEMAALRLERSLSRKSAPFVRENLLLLVLSQIEENFLGLAVAVLRVGSSYFRIAIYRFKKSLPHFHLACYIFHCFIQILSL